MWQAAMGDDGLAASVSSLLITLVFRPLAKNAILMGRSIRSASHAVVSLLARGDGDDDDDDEDGCDDFDDDDDVLADPARRHCERCAARQLGARLSDSDAAAVMASLGLLGGRRDQRDEVGEEADGMAPPSAWWPRCGGCEAMGVVEELAESKAAGEGELREAFGVFDRDGDGFVCAGELWSVMRRLGMAEGARYEDCARMVAARDADGDGRVSFPEFRAMMENAV